MHGAILYFRALCGAARGAISSASRRRERSIRGGSPKRGIEHSRVDSETGVSTKCISCGRCAEQCPNGAIKFIDWEDIAQKVIDQGVVRTTTLVQA